ncbi:transposase [Caldichromatium japonicum]|uniref:Transposase n=1 Tax=Caldichromatium japonicum TaxID=2699430 RepID=A0A6G7VGY0_9GAMM|nr:transposase [Caldichromatium japonicum]QIK39047.1 transposase [Caldichromatium japonicum]
MFYTRVTRCKRHGPALRKAQQAMRRKVKFSNNWKKAKARVQRIHCCIGNARRDLLHQSPTAIGQNQALLGIRAPVKRQRRLAVASCHRRNLRPSGRGGCQERLSHV